MNLLKFIEIQRRETWLHKIPPELKIVTLVFIIYILIWFNAWRCFVYFYVALILVYISIHLFRYFLYFSSLFWLLGSFILLINYILYGTFIDTLNRLVLAHIISISSILLIATTNIESLERFLLRLKLPRNMIKSIVVTYNLIPSLYEEGIKVRNAQYARGLEFSKNPIKRALQSLSIVIPMLFISLIRADSLEKSILARGG